MSRALLVALWIAVAAAVPAAVTPALAKDSIYTGTFSSLAVSGYDPVAYFTQGKPVKGRGDLEHEWQGATWRFADAANLAAFKADPEAYAPQYGGYCAWAVSQGYTASTDPEAWRIVDGKLYLNYSKSVQQTWEEDIPGNIAQGDQNWPGVLD
ncbi:MAG: YHS domain-containing (seleno)protein [Kiloniellales bacterium]|nr:YHS domain-containing (seleno)protein [Kiloniellales bacterium]